MVLLVFSLLSSIWLKDRLLYCYQQNVSVVETIENAQSQLHIKPMAHQSPQALKALLGTETLKQEQVASRTLTLVNLIIYITLFFIFLLLIVSLWLARMSVSKVLKPVKILLLATKKLASGRLDKGIPIVAQDEMG